MSEVLNRANLFDELQLIMQGRVDLPGFRQHSSGEIIKSIYNPHPDITIELHQKDEVIFIALSSDHFAFKFRPQGGR